MDTAVQEQTATTPPRKMRTYGGRRRIESPEPSFGETLGATSPPVRAAVPKSSSYEHHSATEDAELTPKSNICKLMKDAELENETTKATSSTESPSQHASPFRSISHAASYGDIESADNDKEDISFKPGSLLGRLKAHQQMTSMAKSTTMNREQSESKTNASQKSAVAEGLNRFHDMLSRTTQEDEIDTNERKQNKSLASPRLAPILPKTPARQSPTSSVIYAAETPAPPKTKPDQLSKKELEEKRREEQRIKRNQALAIGAKPLYKKPMNEFLATLTSEDALYNSHSSSPVVNQTSSPVPTYSSQTPAEDIGSCDSPLKLSSADKGKGKALNEAQIIRRVVPKVERKPSFSDDSDIEIVLPKTPVKHSLTSPARGEDVTHRKLRMLGAIPISPVAKPLSKQRASASPSAKLAPNSKAQKANGKENWQNDLQHRISQQMALIRAKNEVEARAKGIVIKGPEEWLAERERLNAQLEQMIQAKAGSSQKAKIVKGADEDESDDEDYKEGQETANGIASKSDDEDASDEDLDFLSGSEDEAAAAASGSDREEEFTELADGIVMADMPEIPDKQPEDDLADEEHSVQMKSRRKARRVIDDEDEDGVDVGKITKLIVEQAIAAGSLEDPEALATQPLEDLSQMPANIHFGGMSQFFKPTQEGQPSQKLTDKAFGDGGMSQYFKPSQSQTEETGPRPFENSQVLLAMPTFFGRDSQVDLDEDSQTKLPSIRLSYEDSQTQQPSQYINAEGLLTQTKPTSFSFNDGAGSPQMTGSAPTASIADHPINVDPQASPVVSRRRLSKRSSLADSSRRFSDSEGDDEAADEEEEVNSDDEDPESDNDHDPTQSLNDILRDAAPKKKSAFVDAEAEEEEDEYMGMGGADGSDDGNDSDASELRAMITKGNENVDESLIAEAYQRQEFEKDSRMLTNIMEDLANGGMRRRRGAGFSGLGDSDDEMDGGSARQRRLMKKKRKIDGDDALDALAENPETAAFAKVYTQDDDEDKMDFLDEEDSMLLGTAESQDQVSTQITEDIEEIVPETVQRRGPVHLDLDDEDDADDSLVSGASIFSLKSSAILTSTSSSTELTKASVQTSSTYVASRSAFGSSFTSYNSALVRKTSSSILSPRRLARFASMDDRHGSKTSATSSVTTLVRPALSDNNRQYNVRKERAETKAKSAQKENKSKSKSAGKLLSLLNKEFN